MTLHLDLEYGKDGIIQLVLYVSASGIVQDRHYEYLSYHIHVLGEERYSRLGIIDYKLHRFLTNIICGPSQSETDLAHQSLCKS